MLQVGLTGGIACGKTTVANLFSGWGVPVVDADVIAREVVCKGSEALSEIVDYFGDQVIAEDGTLNRKAMRELIFSNSRSKQKLESILHLRIQQRISASVNSFQQQGNLYCISVIPLLFETNQQDTVDIILVIDCDEEEQIRRIIARDNCSKDEARKIIASQLPRKRRLALADDVILNNGDLTSLEKEVKRLHRRYTEFANSKRPLFE